jgi:uracil-DNA glycosylase family 4
MPWPFPLPYCDPVLSLSDRCATCTDCALSLTRRNVVYGRGPQGAQIMIVGDVPGERDDAVGQPFGGAAGELINKILESADIDPIRDVYFCNLVKCRPAEYLGGPARAPSKEELKTCAKYLEDQIYFIKPAMVLAAGSLAAQSLLGLQTPLSLIRGRWFDWKNGVRVMPIFHPTYLLHNDSKEPGSPKWSMWQDIKKVSAQINRGDKITNGNQS